MATSDYAIGCASCTLREGLIRRGQTAQSIAQGQQRYSEICKWPDTAIDCDLNVYMACYAPLLCQQGLSAANNTLY